MKKLRQFLQECSGQAVAEFAVMLPVFVLVGFGLVDMTWMAKDAGNSEYIANEVARCESLNGMNPTSPLPCNNLSPIPGVNTPETYARYLAQNFRLTLANFSSDYQAPYSPAFPCQPGTGLCEIRIRYQYKSLGVYFPAVTITREGLASYVAP